MLITILCMSLLYLAIGYGINKDNAKYLIDVLQHIKTKEVNIYLSAPLSAATIQETDNSKEDETINLLMPLRLNN